MGAKLLLFDIDGTLLHAGGAGRRSLELALAERFPEHRGAFLEGLKLDGMTDRLIVKAGMERAGVPFDLAVCAEVLAAYAARLSREIHGEGYRVLPGVPPLLESLRGRGAALALGTGNIEEGARIKLDRGGLAGFFGWGEESLGGFGGDGEAREEILLAALRRASRRLGPLAPSDALVIGDTARDVTAALAVGCRVVAVATGRYSAAELSGAGAPRVLSSLAGPEVLALLLG